MALNPQNLKVPTSEEARINGSKGGKASVEAKRRKKTMKEMFEALLTAENTEVALGKTLKKYGFEEHDNYHMAKIIIEVLKKAENGDLKAVDMIMKLLYGNQQDVNLNIEGKMETKSRVNIYLPERDEDPE